MKRILVIEDEPEMLLALEDNLELEGYDVITASDGEEGLRKAIQHRPDAIILDIMLPKLSGFDVCQMLRSRGIDSPILILSARAQESDKILGLGIGADDYVTKPVSINELLARVRALLRRANASPSRTDRYRFGDVEIDFRRQKAQKSSEKLSLTTLELKVLRYLIERRGEVVSRERLLGDVWGYSILADSRTIDSLVARLRKKVESDPRNPEHILTVHGGGYKFED